MTTKMRILSGLALSAATLVIAPLSSDEASARGLGGANSSAVARSSTTSPATQRTLKSSQTTLKTSKLREVDKDPGKTKIEKEKHKRHRAIYPVLIGPALLAVDPPGCVYERRVQKLPGGGLQRVIVKVCPGV